MIDGFEEKVKGTRWFVFEAKRGEILRDRVDLMSFREFCENRRREEEQPTLFDEP